MSWWSGLRSRWLMMSSIGGARLMLIIFVVVSCGWRLYEVSSGFWCCILYERWGMGYRASYKMLFLFGCSLFDCVELWVTVSVSFVDVGVEFGRGAARLVRALFCSCRLFILVRVKLGWLLLLGAVDMGLSLVIDV